MPKEKTNWKQIHKIKVHDNRWLAWTIAIAVLVCASLVAYIQVTDINFSTQMSFSSGPNSNWLTFNHRAQGYSVKYPRNWGLETDTDNDFGMSFVNPQDSNEYFSVSTYLASDEDEIRRSLFTSNELPVKISGVNGTKISQSRNQPESVAMVLHGDMLFLLRGKGGNFDRILATFKFNHQLE
jgi:hypothetical protein